jgi:hypothetical protein
MLNGSLGSISVGTDRAPVAYSIRPLVTTTLSPEFVGNEELMRPLLATLPTGTLRALAAWCTAEADARTA